MDEPSIPAHPLRAGAEADLARLIERIVDLTGLPTRWRGVVIVRGAEFGHAGQKHGWCGISLREDVLPVPELRWTTMIHEGLHSVSAAFSSGRLDPTNARWEEAIVEQTQRLLRTELLQAVELQLNEERLTILDNLHLYNRYIQALEVLRGTEGRSARDFYLELLASTAAGRARLIIAATRILSRPHGTES